jgi:surface protein
MSHIITDDNIRERIQEARYTGETISHWDVSSVTDMSYLFDIWEDFNQDLSEWDVSNVTNMSYMFCRCEQFDQDLNNWDVSNVTNMSYMFYGCAQFDQDLNNWDVSNVTNMGEMFNGCLEFNGDLSEWRVSNVTNMSDMFYGCEQFDQDLSNWNVSNVTNMGEMFNGCRAFNGDLSNWNVSNVTNMHAMFSFCREFNGDLSNWNVSNVTNMGEMFYECSAFDQTLNGWDVGNVTNMQYMFSETRLLRRTTPVAVFAEPGIDPSSLVNENAVNTLYRGDPALIAPNTGVAVAFEVHKAFAKFDSIRKKYLEIIGQIDDFKGDGAEFRAYVHTTFMTKITELFTGEDREKELKKFDTVFIKACNDLSRPDLDPNLKQLIAKSIYFVFSQEDKEFQKHYIRIFLDETTNAYEPKYLGQDTTSCIKGVLERFVTSVGGASQVICIEENCDPIFKQLDRLFHKDELINELASKWWSEQFKKQEEKEEKEEMSTETLTQNFIKDIVDELKRLQLYNEDDLLKIEKYAETNSVLFSDLISSGPGRKSRSPGRKSRKSRSPGRKSRKSKSPGRKSKKSKSPVRKSRKSKKSKSPVRKTRSLSRSPPRKTRILRTRSLGGKNTLKKTPRP